MGDYTDKQKVDINECYFMSRKDTSSATICANCGKEKHQHIIGEGIKVTKTIYYIQIT